MGRVDTREVFLSEGKGDGVQAESLVRDPAKGGSGCRWRTSSPAVWLGPLMISRSEPQPDTEEDHGGKAFERLGIGQILDADDGAEEHPGQGADDHRPGQGPDHAPFPDIAVDTAGDGDDVEQMVGGADRGGRKMQNTDLKGQEDEGAGDPAHGGEKGNPEGHQRRQPGADLDAGDGEIHALPISCSASGSGSR